MGSALRRRKRNRVTENLFRLASDPRDTAIYGVAEAAGYVGVPRGTLRHWLKAPKSGRAVIEAADSDAGKLSFYNLLEAHVLRIALERDTWLQRVRLAVETLRERAPNEPHPLLARELFTASGYRNVFAKTMTGGIEDLTFSGQMVFRQMLSRYLSRIEFDNTGPFQLRPYGFQHVIVNHRVSGGRPVVRGTGILVELIASRLRAGEPAEELARDYNISTADVREALKYTAA